jgi:lysyl-tRNA synthetase class I
VLFAHTAPYHIRYDVIDGQDHHLIILVAGDVIGSEDLATNLKTREVRYLAMRDEETNTVEHRLIDERGNAWLPADAWRAENE